MNGVRFGELPFLKEEWAVSVCAYSPDGGMLAVGGEKKVTSIYDTTTWNGAHQHLVEEGWSTCAAFSANSQQIVYGMSRGKVQLWNIVSKDAVMEMAGHTSWIRSVAFSPCGKQLASASDDKTVRLWNSETGECMFILEGHTAAVDDIAFSTDGKRLVSGSGKDGTIRVWDPETGEPIDCWKITRSEDSTLAFSADGQWAAVSLQDGRIQITNAVTGEPGAVLNNGTIAKCIAFSSNGQWIVTSSKDNTVRLWDISSGLLISSFSGHTHRIITCTFSPNCSHIVSTDYEGYVRLWEVDTSRAILDLDRPTSPVLTVAYSPDGRSILSGSDGQGVQQWDSKTGVPSPLPFKMADNISSFAFSPDGNQIATGHKDGTIRLQSHQADTTECTLLGHTCEVFPLVYSSCGRWIFSIGWKEARLWDLHTKEHPGVIARTDDVWWVAQKGRAMLITYCVALTPTYSPCGKWILSGSEDKTIRIWRFRTGEVSNWSCVAIVGGCSKGITCLSWNPVEALEFVTGCEDGSVRVWRITSHDDDDGGDMSVQMLWSNDVGLLCALDLTFEGAIGLSPRSQKLLVQRGAIEDLPPSKGQEAFAMSNHPRKQLNPQVLGSESLNSIVRIKKRNKFRISKSKSKNVNDGTPGDTQSAVLPPVIQKPKLQSSLQPSPPNRVQVVMNIFPDNVPKPVIKTKLPCLQERIESTEQLVYYTSLLLQDSLPSVPVPGDDVISDATLCLQEPTLDKAELDWLENIKKDPTRQDYLYWLLSQMVEAFVTDTTKGSLKVAEIVALGPVLQKEYYRKLLS
ncbi:hypothetical protein BGZ95_005817, partial [Linnemannia exigua]